jgi:hypothetical protein
MVPAMLEQPPDFFHLFMNKSKNHFTYTRYPLHFCTSFSSQTETRVLRVCGLALVLVYDLCFSPQQPILGSKWRHLTPTTSFKYKNK